MPSTESASILVAEDNRVLSDVLRFNLERHGYTVVIARNGQQAMEQLEQQPFDLLITDFQMPGANGDELIRFARQTLGLDDLPIVMCSAKGLELDMVRLQSEWQVSRVIFKPFSMREILQLIGELLPRPLPLA
jgi:CheY-like chemotaxis protein